jgi:enolase-phosphatase E1
LIDLQVDAVVMDVEGTTSSISFVHDQMFPYARKRLREFCAENWSSPSLAESVNLLAKDAGYTNSAAWFAASADTEDIDLVVRFASQLMDRDSKATGLKSLQGLIWRSGFESGELRSHLYDDVPDAITSWHKSGLQLAIYSSGSVAAQRLFFGHTIFGDFSPMIIANFDTTTGPKGESDSYSKIAHQLHLSPPRILFLSDVAAELMAASAAGLQAVAVVRPGNATLADNYRGERIDSFRLLNLS